MKIAKMVKKIFSILFSIYLIGIIGGILFYLLESIGRVRIYNYWRLPLWEGNLILAANHPSWLDVVILPLLYFPWWFRSLIMKIVALLRYPLRLAQGKPLDKELSDHFKDIPVSTADKHNVRRFWGILDGWNIFINRKEEGLSERTTALRRAIEVLKNNGRIATYPSGGRDLNAERYGDGIYDIKTRRLILRTPKAGIAEMVRITGAVIVPIRLENTDKVWPDKAYKKFPFIPRFWWPIDIRIGEPIRLPAGTDEEIVLKSFIDSQIKMFHEGR